MVAFSSNDPVNVSNLQSTFDGAGYLVKYDASGLIKTASVTDTPVGVTIDESSRDVDGTLEAAGSNTVSVLPLSGVVFVKLASAIASPVFGMSIYVSQTASDDGTCDDDSSNSATLLGYYFGEEKALAAGDLIPVSVA